MKLKKPISALIVTTALFGGLASTSAFADLPRQPQSIKVMDTNKNGKIEKEEFVAFMSKEFDKAAGSKGYCTFDEIVKTFDEMDKIYRNY